MFGIKRSVQRIGKEEAGITALETAIILIAFVVVASVFAFTVLSAGVFSAQPGKIAVDVEPNQAHSTLELKGSVLAISSGAGGTVDSLIFFVATSTGGEPINLSETDRAIHIEYRDSTQRQTIANWSITWKVRNDTDDLLQRGELAEISVPVDNLTTPPGINTEFAVAITPPIGAALNIRRTMPAHTDLVYDLR